jgi:opacity protein-like surface antigen
MPAPRSSFRALLAAVFVAASSLTASAQTVTGLSPRQLLIKLGSAAGQAGGGAALSNVGEVIADLVGLTISTAPLGSSAGGFTFDFDPVTRTFVRAAPSFGPSFSERAVTTGEGRGSFGMSFSHSTFDSLDGFDLRDGSLRTVILNGSGGPLYEGRAELTITADTLVIFGNIGLNDRFDVGVAVPIVRLEVSGRHTIDLDEATGEGSASGLGDVAIRAKWRIVAHGGGGFAATLDARVPSGDKEALLGAGVTRSLVSGVWSATTGRLSPHASVGFEYWSDPFELRDPLTGGIVSAGRHGYAYDAGVEYAVSDRLTVNGELLGRTVLNGARLGYTTVPVRAGNPFGIESAAAANAVADGLSRASLAGGVKWNVAGSLLLNANVLAQLTSAGLRDRFTPFVGFDWGF